MLREGDKGTGPLITLYLDGHRLGYFVSCYCLHGFDGSESHGWAAEYDFGRAKAIQR